MKQTIVFTGGGSAGHVSGNLVLIPKCAEEKWDIHYIGSKQGIERMLVSDCQEVKYHAISTGKLRRYFSWKNGIDIFKVMRGICQSFRLIKKLKPNVIFSKGGFVAVPVVLGARLNKVPIIIYEPDLNLGLANKISLPFATHMCTAFHETAKKPHYQKAIYVGPIIKEAYKSGNTVRGLSACGFTSEKPVLLIMGGSQGAHSLNQMVKSVLYQLVEKFQVIHICGKGKVEDSLSIPGYKSYEFVRKELPDLLAAAAIIVSRAGSNSIMELLALQKPMLLIPHTKGGSRSGQRVNAQYFQQAGYADMLLEEQMTDQSFMKAIQQLYENRFAYIAKMKKHDHGGGAAVVMDLIRGERSGLGD
ncbi:UDP-N-acetylglucosamine--N-acetylmuramyl-(pentapeptide) pyrophosphoryl-undecaprenol N-acetylglucosamine transferase [Paenibacillus ferrarius]|uniref:UDP-N-acetylglucosamine--N-acetylmuramyl-(pentapeptide) pyrophosphoryl-undecaprenol N-acetylglucosamine transferase n=1 Tax=Paenibacillus ferrarius TaxID=1469647 RepID=A0A1V4HL65_9BACL|nr:undecaprenyldiphospho-muramoylpentapeptide beta-N-acetylglucosaminyltransferase [Paenibacillus ferrarius]OPH58139.1 UDP-N-acetylglucosamine--N-acetylmuramyl-(pentapeptide) pyrophosphoryl-undecaprenol N-acetylglucosamine transferase [Paenibacillus ferrarius]